MGSQRVKFIDIIITFFFLLPNVKTEHGIISYKVQIMREVRTTSKRAENHAVIFGINMLEES